MEDSSATAACTLSQQDSSSRASSGAAGGSVWMSNRCIDSAESWIRSRMSSIPEMSRWMSLRSKGVMNVECSSWTVSYVTLSALRSSSPMRAISAARCTWSE